MSSKVSQPNGLPLEIAVVGAGIAGLAAAWACAKEGAPVRVFTSWGGASSLYSGALDYWPWVDPRNNSAPLLEIHSFVTALEIWEINKRLCRLCTSQGVVRTAAGRDHQLLDLEGLAGKRIAVLDTERDDWDAPMLARSWGSSPWAVETNTQFVPVPVRVLKAEYERRISAYDFAVLHDRIERVEWFSEQLLNTSAHCDAWLLGPWLGLEPRTVQLVRSRLRLPVGETTSLPGGAAGARFELARDRLLSRLAIPLVRERVERLLRKGVGYELQFAGGKREAFSAVVLACGGVLSGGIALGNSLLERGAPCLQINTEPPVELWCGGALFEGGSQLWQTDLSSWGLRVVERLGLNVDAKHRVRGTGPLFAAGDVVADGPRTVLQAVASGLRAGSAVAVLATVPKETRR